MGTPELLRVPETGEDERDDGNSAASDDEDSSSPAGSPANTWQLKRRAQKAIFESWLVSPAGEEARKPRTKDGRLKEEVDEQQSIHSLLAQQQKGAPIVKNPREYQLELFERAKKENTIAVLDTGSGKTLIAVLLLRSVIDDELEKRAAGHAPKISFFLVASVTLVYQQFSVLDCNLDHKVIRLCGADNVDRWTAAHWTQIFHENKVVVCTADILFQCLSRSFLSMKQINLLIFDEAHHTKKNHAYARIIKDFYIPEQRELRPRIFGMTASPIDAKVDVIQAASELESLLDCKIATTQDMSLAEAIKRPTEEILRYDALPQRCFETSLLQDLKSRYGNIEVFASSFQRAAEVARHLGRWCADNFLLHAFSHEKSSKYSVEVEKKWHARKGRQKVAELDEAVKEIQAATHYIQQRSHVLDELSRTQDLSSKVRQLDHYLRLQFERESTHRAIVFVDRRYTARLLHNLYTRLRGQEGYEYLRGHFLIGSNGGSIDEDSFSFRQQVMTLMKFRKGELNCLFATSVAEEGLDVPDCNLVIRFDMYNTMIQYVQSRGRARNQHSKFIHMIENGNCAHQQTLGEVRWQENSMRRFCDQLPEDRKLQGNEDHLEMLLDKEKNIQVRIVPSTGAKLTYGNALDYIANFVSAIPTDCDEPQHPTYEVMARGQKFQAEVMLPNNAPLRSVMGAVHAKKGLAKRSAAFNACIELLKLGYFDAYFLPTYTKKLPAMRNALLAVDMKKQHGYAMCLKPSIWAEQRGSLPGQLYVTVIDFPKGLDRPHQSMAFLTRSRMPHFPAFSVYLNDGRKTSVVSKSLSKPIVICDHELAQITKFTFRVFEDVFSKTYEEDSAQLSYWLAPANVQLSSQDEDNQHLANGDPDAMIDWSLLDEAFTVGERKWTLEMPESSLSNIFLVDVWDGSRKFYSKGVDPSKKATDPIPEGVAKSKLTGTILDYSVSLWKKARQERDATWSREQPVIEAEKILTQRKNMLAPPELKEVRQDTKAFLCVQPLRISTIPPEVAAPLFIWPAIIYRFESHLISQEGCNVVGVDCGPEFALAAFTKDSDNSGEHEVEERVNFQRGMGENYERFEFIGDTFLKTATTLSTFILNPNENEFEFHVRRMLMLCNKNLFQTAMGLKLYEYIRSLPFNRRLWYPEGMKLLAGTGVVKGEEKVMWHQPRDHPLGEKTIADVCEALIGAAFIAHDCPGDWKPEHWESAIRAVTKLVNNDDHKMQTWEDYKAAYAKPAYQMQEATAVQKDLADKVELEHLYRFQYPRLLYSAFVHPSLPFMYEKVPNYQRLEFLGDALLDMASISYLFYKYPDKDPQWLTEHKMAMVSNKFLGALCVNIGFHKHLRHHHAKLEHQVREYAIELLEAKRVAGDSRDYWTTVSDPPKCLPDIIESYVGALFIDSDFNYAEVQRFFDIHIRWFFEDMKIYDTFANNHPCTHLHNMLQTTFGCTDYRLMAKELPSADGLERTDVVAVVMIHDKIVAHSSGKSGRYARLRVANRALAVLDGLAPFEYRARFECECRVDEEGPMKILEGQPQHGGMVDCAPGLCDV
ncbi:hypothetical protein DOTSEDRAFT_56023 [Dothistroma septosporum NZE10]|uniref:Dicer-like protein 1 n=1 Tax=Dothistroma septosporum (strain NZE10 / CBS 128990) TaxID=675120 RepID=N1PFR8_DOTSN|nr:hypothetical protein DOTSEDRAFT_56023 [Dothistroma septosporum NZE10]